MNGVIAPWSSGMSDSSIPEGAIPVAPSRELQGQSYLDVLAAFHAMLQPQTYLEIGTCFGDSLALANCASLAIDPDFRLQKDVVGKKPACTLWQMGSDLFFRRHDPSAILGGPVDMAFLDGMHIWEFLLRDFANTERYCRRNSVILMHDCIPGNAYMARRDIQSTQGAEFGGADGGWAGDVWKAVVALRRFRPDLVISALDAAPTGLIVVTNLDPSSRVLTDKYFEIVDANKNLDLFDYGVERYHSEIGVEPAAGWLNMFNIAGKVWL
jgi:hypothetical protein